MDIKEQQSELVDEKLQPVINKNINLEKSVSLQYLQEIIEEIQANKHISVDSPLSVITPDQALIKQQVIKKINADLEELNSRSQTLIDNIKNKLANYDYSVDITNNIAAQKAVKKTFKKKSKVITKEMYLEALKLLEKIQQDKFDESLK